jgi:seryl-tRNA synthetase
MHLTEHTQLVENQSRTFFYSHERTLNDLNNKLQCLSISPRILESPFIQLEKWRTEAHQKLDQLAEQKRQEIETKISEYRIIFTKKSNEQKQKIEILKKRIKDFSRQTHLANKDIQYLEDKINETTTFLQSIEKHSIKVSAYAFFVDIRTNFFDSRTVQSPTIVQPMRNTRSEVKEFVSKGNKQRLDKKRSLSVVSLL